MSASTASMRRLVALSRPCLRGSTPTLFHSCTSHRRMHVYRRLFNSTSASSASVASTTPHTSTSASTARQQPPATPPAASQSTAGSSSQSSDNPSLPPPPPSASSTSTPPPPPSPPSHTSNLPPPPPPPRSKSGPVTWTSVGLMLLTAGGLLAYYNYEKERKQTAFQPVVSIGRAALGGPFTLTAHTGEEVSSEQLKGRYAMVYFGFTHCPDICPTELAKMEAALSAYHAQYPQYPITPVFISIDPQRDTPQRMAAYKAQYSPSFLFLTGTPQQIKDVARSYRVYYSAPDEAAEGGSDDYLVDHSIFFYLLDRQGEVMDYYGKNVTSDEIVKKLLRIIPEDNKQKPAGR